MHKMRMKLSRKQHEALQILSDPQIVDALLGGGAGGSKSLTICLWMLFELRNFPGIRIGLGRKELTRLKQTTVVTLLREAHPMLGIKEKDYTYSEQKGVITYINGSSIQLVDLAYLPSDPDFDRFGSLNFTHTVIEEGGEILKKAKDVFTSRKNRYLNGEFKIVGKSITTCNPSQNFLKKEYYEPYKKLGAGEYQKWEHGRVEINGEMKVAYQCFIRALASDNPFIPLNYIEVLRKLPPAERKRLLEGNWNYKDSDLMLFPSSLIDRILSDVILPGDVFVGVDIADAGDDESILSLIRGNMLFHQEKITVDKTKAIGEQIALRIIEVAQRNGINASTARRIAIDVIGVGASTRDLLRSKGWFVREFVAGAAPEDFDKNTNDKSVLTFRNLRGQTVYELSQDMDKDKFKIYSKIETIEELRDQLMAHEYTTEEKVILVKNKKLIKEVLGRSPDNAESAYIAFWASKGDNDPRHNTSRIDY